MRDEASKEEKIIIKAVEDKVASGELTFKTKVSRDSDVFISASDYRLSITEWEIRGGELYVRYTYDAGGLDAGDKRNGEITAVTDEGEFFFSYEIDIREACFDSSIGEIKNLFHFTNLAKTSWKEAVTLFEDPGFNSILRGGNSSYKNIREALLYNTAEEAQKSRALENFLVYIRKKDPIKLTVKETNFIITPDSPGTIYIEVEKTGWGYEDIRIHDQTPGLSFEKTEYFISDFSDNKLEIPVRIDRIRLSAQGSKGGLILSIGSRDIRISIAGKSAGKNTGAPISDSDERHVVIKIMRLYLDYRTGHMSLKECAAQAEEKLKLIRGRETVLPTLYEAHLKLLLSDKGTAAWLIDHVKKLLRKEDAGDEVYGYFLYLLAMNGTQDSERAANLLATYSETKPNVFSYFWGNMHVKGKGSENTGRAYRSLKNIWKMGNSSPVLFLEAALLVLKNPSLYENMEEFELKLLFFMERYQLISEDFVPQVFEAASSYKRYSPMLLSILKRYPAENEKQMLKVFCTQYLRGGCKGKEVASVLRRGIEADCRITGLYEAYIRALDFDEEAELPREAVHYFSYGSSLDDAGKAYVYSMLLKQREDMNDKQMSRAREFTLEELKKGHISRSLATLYCNLLEPEDMTEELKDSLVSLVFAMDFKIKDEKGYGKSEWIYVRHNGMEKVGKYQIKAGRGVIFLYGDDHSIALEDKRGRISIPPSEAYEISSFFENENVAYLLKGAGLSGFEQAYYFIGKNPVETAKDKDEFISRSAVACKLMESRDLSGSKKHDIAEAILYGYQKYEIPERKEEFLKTVPATFFKGKAGELFVKELLSVGMYEKAYEAAAHTGFDRFDSKVLIRLCNYALCEAEGEYDERLTAFTYYVFEKHKYTIDMLEYLVNHYRGPVKQMRDVWKRAASMDVFTLPIAERILTQMMRTGSYTADRALIFKDYARSGGRSELILSYLTDMAFAYVSKEEAVENEFFDEAEALLKQDDEGLPIDILLAVLKKKSSEPLPISDEGNEWLKELIETAFLQGYYFPYYRHFEEVYPSLRLKGEETFVEYRDEPGLKITLHYLVEHNDPDEDEEGKYNKEPLYEVYPGVYQRGFKILHGERVVYYLTQKEEDDEKMLISGSLEISDDIEGGGSGKFRLLNDLALARELDDRTTVSELERKLGRLETLTKDNLKIR